MIFYTADYAAAGLQAGRPMTHARLLWDNLPGVISASGSADGRPAERAGQIDTASWWQPDVAPGWWQITYPAPQLVDAVGIAAHHLAGVTLRVEAEVGGVWREMISVVPADGSALLLLFGAVQATALRLHVDARALIGVVYTGQALAMPHPGYTSVGLVDLGRDATLTSHVSEGGQLLLRTLQRTGLSGQCAWEHLTEDWYRGVFDPFALRARTEPFFLASRPQRYPRDCVYGWVDAPIVPTRMGVKNFLSVSFALKAHAHE